MKSKSKKVGTCTYCAVEGPVTDDHVPPRNLFANTPENHLIKVDACEGCNRTFSKDDEWFRDVIGMHRGLTGNAAADSLVDTVERSMARKESHKYWDQMSKTLSPLEFYSSGGIYLETVGGFIVDVGRLNRFATRTVRGLHFHGFGVRIPDDALIKMRLATQWETDIRFECSAVLSKSPPCRIGNDIFEYQSKQAAGGDNSSLWFLRFFGSVEFLGVVKRNGSSDLGYLVSQVRK